MIHKTISEKTKFKIEAEQKDWIIEQYKQKLSSLEQKLKDQMTSLEKYKSLLKTVQQQFERYSK